MSPTSLSTPPKRLFCPNSTANVPSSEAQAVRTRTHAGRIPKSAGLSRNAQRTAPTAMDPANEANVTWFAVTPVRASSAAIG